MAELAEKLAELAELAEKLAEKSAEFNELAEKLAEKPILAMGETGQLVPQEKDFTK